jgi:hypothetical protein
MECRTEPFGFYHGACWMKLDGTMYIVPGFHDEWIQDHPELVGTDRTVSEMVVNKRWISVVVYSEGYVEFCIKDRKDCEVLSTLFDFLIKNKDKWINALIMPMEEEGFIQFAKSSLSSKEEFFAKIALSECGE